VKNTKQFGQAHADTTGTQSQQMTEMRMPAFIHEVASPSLALKHSVLRRRPVNLELAAKNSRKVSYITNIVCSLLMT